MHRAPRDLLYPGPVKFDMAPLLRVDNLRTSFFTSDGEVRAVDGVTLEIGNGRTLGLVENPVAGRA